MRLQNRRFIIETTIITDEETFIEHKKMADRCFSSWEGEPAFESITRALSIMVREKPTNTVTRFLIYGDYYSFEENFNCVLLETTRLVVLTSDTLFFIALPSGDLAAESSVFRDEYSLAFDLYPFSGGYVIHGELETVMFDKHCRRLWSFSARDIFVFRPAHPELDPFKIEGNHIVLHDWLGWKYVLDAKGRCIEERQVVVSDEN
ncbi:MAG: hypothetical protein LBR61_03230 [Synergistaceae bacterium]|jgi:hypothetical protein|nr:hypothetical protein [Synergistaceae bacterium]